MTGFVNIALTPHQAMQLLRWRTFLSDAIKDPDNIADDYDRAGTIEAIESICSQVKKKITIPQLEEAEAQQAVYQLTNKKQ
jgi:hypothetical protein